MHKFLTKTLFLGKKVLFLPECPSTNDIASGLVKTGQAMDGYLVATENQTKGRGQRGNQWFSEPGKNLTFSLILKPTFLSLENQFFLNILSSLAIAKYLMDCGIPDVQVKWPNDVYVANQKIAGILIENNLKEKRLEWTILGIGLNLFQTEALPEGATSLALQAKSIQGELSWHLEELVFSLEKFYLTLRSGKLDELKKAYMDQLMGFGTWKSYRDAEGEFEGKITDVLESGRLRVVKRQSSQFYDYAFKEIVQEPSH